MNTISKEEIEQGATERFKWKKQNNGNPEYIDYHETIGDFTKGAEWAIERLQPPQSGDDMTLEECREKIAKDRGYSSWKGCHGKKFYTKYQLVQNVNDESAELYASQFKAKSDQLEQENKRLKDMVHEWISVADDLPEENISVMWCKYPVEEPYVIMSMCDDDFDHYPENYFTHWMPLPSAPKALQSETKH
ncbi:MAG: DUF551 domain-containing protein [Pedobacter sp.]|nr:MAG: DUF551 domain-containing protein [Pedobacter sp.]